MKAVILALFLCLAIVSLTTAKEIKSSELWDRYRDELITFLARGRPSAMKTLQLFPQAFEAEWDTDPEILQHFCLNPPRWGPLWEFNTKDTNLYGEYKNFLYSLRTEYSTENNAFTKSLDDLYDKEFELFDAIEAAAARCAKDHERHQKSFAGMSLEEYQRAYCFELNDLNEERRHLKARMVAYGRRAYGGQKQFLAAQAITKMTNFKSTNKFIELTTLADFNERNRKGQFNKLKFQVTQSSKFNKEQSSYKSFSFSLGIPSFFSIGVGSNKQKYSLKTSNEEFSMDVSATSWAAIKVMPNPKWFSGQVLSDWEKGPFRSAATSRNTYFGSKGKLALMPKTFYVVYQPSVSLQINKDDVSKFESSKSFGFNIGIGPLTFNFNKGSTVQKEDLKNGLYRFTIKGNSKTPTVLAVDHVELPN